MSILTMFREKPASHTRNTPRVFRISNPAGKALLKRYANKSDDYLAACILASLNTSRQSEMRLPATTIAPPARVSNVLKKMLSRGLIAPVRRENV